MEIKLIFLYNKQKAHTFCMKINMKILNYLGKHLQLDESTCVFKSHAFLLIQKHGIYMNFWCYSNVCSHPMERSQNRVRFRVKSIIIFSLIV